MTRMEVGAAICASGALLAFALVLSRPTRTRALRALRSSPTARSVFHGVRSLLGSSRRARELAAQGRSDLGAVLVGIARLEERLSALEGGAVRAHAPVASSAVTSRVCRQSEVASTDFHHFCDEIRHPLQWHRKLWEFFYIARTLSAAGALVPGSRGLVFGVGAEPLVALFAARECRITATDMDLDAAKDAGWAQNHQHARSLERLARPDLCSPERFREHVEFRVVDMNAVPKDLVGFDFVWSACALEHLGSLESGLAFIRASLDCLKPGGVAVHTTEYNLASNYETIEAGPAVLYRRRDLEVLCRSLAAEGHAPAPLDLDPGGGFLDGYVDLPPYRSEPHLRVRLERFVTTSVGLMIRRRTA